MAWESRGDDSGGSSAFGMAGGTSTHHSLVLWITNAFNLIDGLDGLAAGSAFFSTLVTCVVAILFHSEGILFLVLALAGAMPDFSAITSIQHQFFSVIAGVC